MTRYTYTFPDPWVWVPEFRLVEGDNAQAT
jgi:hypothetical protein